MLPYITKGLQENYATSENHNIRLNNHDDRLNRIEEKINEILQRIGEEG